GQANSASNLAALMNPHRASMLAYAQPFIPGVHPGSASTPHIRNSSSLRTFVNERGDDSGASSAIYLQPLR
ncbi:MAG: hypothetical protein AAF705_13885, partial [Bacteroidota bacterium]